MHRKQGPLLGQSQEYGVQRVDEAREPVSKVVSLRWSVTIRVVVGPRARVHQTNGGVKRVTRARSGECSLLTAECLLLLCEEALRSFVSWQDYARTGRNHD
jgi:hypothetical protein